MFKGEFDPKATATTGIKGSSVAGAMLSIWSQRTAVFYFIGLHRAPQVCTLNDACLLVSALTTLKFYISTQVKGHRNVFVNPPRLSDFKQVLTKAGIQVNLVTFMTSCACYQNL